MLLKVNHPISSIDVDTFVDLAFGRHPAFKHPSQNGDICILANRR
jgi:hypothetical protein